MPGWITDNAQAELRDHFFAENAKHLRISDEFGRTPFGIDQPFSTSTHMTVLFLDLTVELNKRTSNLRANAERLQGEIKACKACHKNPNAQSGTDIPIKEKSS